MDSHVEIITNDGDLARQVWRFWYGRDGAELDSWRRETRQTTRHKFRSGGKLCGDVWTRLDQRDNRIDCPYVPDAVADAALDAFRQSIKMKTS